MQPKQPKPAHTPGPWFAHNIGGLPNGPYTYPLGTDPELAAANARLCAAAPDLLDALSAVLCCIEAEWGADLLPFNLSDAAASEVNAAIKAARAAIAKATGVEA